MRRSPLKSPYLEPPRALLIGALSLAAITTLCLVGCAKPPAAPMAAPKTKSDMIAEAKTLKELEVMLGPGKEEDVSNIVKIPGVELKGRAVVWRADRMTTTAFLDDDDNVVTVLQVDDHKKLELDVSAGKARLKVRTEEDKP
jgi:hypothetical protein